MPKDLEDTSLLKNLSFSKEDELLESYSQAKNNLIEFLHMTNMSDKLSSLDKEKLREKTKLILDSARKETQPATAKKSPILHKEISFNFPHSKAEEAQKPTKTKLEEMGTPNMKTPKIIDYDDSNLSSSSENEDAIFFPPEAINQIQLFPHSSHSSSDPNLNRKSENANMVLHKNENSCNFEEGDINKIIDNLYENENENNTNHANVDVDDEVVSIEGKRKHAEISVSGNESQNENENQLNGEFDCSHYGEEECEVNRREETLEEFLQEESKHIMNMKYQRVLQYLQQNQLVRLLKLSDETLFKSFQYELTHDSNAVSLESISNIPNLKFLANQPFNQK